MAARSHRRRLVLVGVVAAMLFAGLAPVPSFAATKKYEIGVQPSSAGAGVPTAFTVTVTNRTPGNSTINSLSVDVPFPFDPATARLLPSSNPNTRASVTIAGSRVRVQNVDSVKTGQFVKLEVTATPPTGCTATSWPATVYAGNSLNGDTFSPIGTYPPTVSITGGAVVATKLAITTVFDGDVGTAILSSDTPAHFIARPSSASTSRPFTAVVEGQDASGNPAPVCQDTSVTLSENGAGTLGGTTTGVLTTGSTSVTFNAVTYNNGGVTETVDLTATDTAPGILTPGTTKVDFNASLAVASGTPGTPGALTTSGSCTPTSSTPFCVTWSLPNGWSQTAALFVEDCPAGQCTFGLLAGFIADLKDGSGAALYDNSEPFDFFTFEIGCDRSVCGGGRLSRYVISIDPDDVAGPLGYIVSPACTPSVNDFIDPYNPSTHQTFCTDYSGSHRDNNQDTILLVRAAGIDGRHRM